MKGVMTMHITLPVFQIVVNSNCGIKKLHDIIDEGALYDFLEKNFDADYFDVLDISYDNYKKEGDLLEDFSNGENRYEFTKEKLKNVRLDFLDRVMKDSEKCRNEYDQNNWDVVINNLKCFDDFNYPELMILDEYGDIFDAGSLPTLRFGEEPVILTYVGCIDYHS